MIEIYGTLGPACRDEKILREMFEAGMTGMRLNLSHTSLEQSMDLLNAYHAAARAAGTAGDLLIDMQGPELRLGVLEPYTVQEGSTVVLGKDAIPVPQFLLEQLLSGDRILIDDGRIEMQMVECGAQYRAMVLRGGVITSRKSIKVENRNIYGPTLTEADLENLKQAHRFGVTAIMQPFVRSRQDLCDVRQALKNCGCDDLRIFAKIENMEGVSRIDEIIDEADMIVIARGDLGNDMPLWHLPAVQKQLESACRKRKRAFMVVTQMLTSMLENRIPTRAEVSDIFNAAADGASAVMVTNETAVGWYPADVIRYLANTAAEGEAYYYSADRF